MLNTDFYESNNACIKTVTQLLKVFTLNNSTIISILGFIVEETQEIFTEGIKPYLRNMWNFIDFTRNVLYTTVFILRVASFIQQQNEIENNPSTATIRREDWNAFDPQLIAEGLFAAANIFRSEISHTIIIKIYYSLSI